MKNLALLLFLLVSSVGNLFAQKESDAFIGYWKPKDNGTNTEIVIWKDVRNQFQMISVDRSDGEMLEISNLKISNKKLTVTMRTPSTDWVIKCVYTLEDNTNMKEVITGEKETVLFWEKVK